MTKLPEKIFLLLSVIAIIILTMRKWKRKNTGKERRIYSKKFTHTYKDCKKNTAIVKLVIADTAQQEIHPTSISAFPDLFFCCLRLFSQKLFSAKEKPKMLEHCLLNLRTSMAFKMMNRLRGGDRKGTAFWGSSTSSSINCVCTNLQTATSSFLRTTSTIPYRSVAVSPPSSLLLLPSSFSIFRLLILYPPQHSSLTLPSSTLLPPF